MQGLKTKYNQNKNSDYLKKFFLWVLKRAFRWHANMGVADLWESTPYK